MTGGQIAALLLAILLLLPGGCFLVVGISVAMDPHYADAAFVALPIAAAILALAGFLFWIAFRRRSAARPEAEGGGNPRP
jgi:membrane protein implicated in regulation of membrane protease activity